MPRLLLLAFIWGWSFFLIKVGVDGLTPSTVAASRILLGAVVLHVVCRAKGLVLPRDPRLWGHFAVVGLLGSALPFTLLAWGEERVSSALTSVLNASTPLFTGLFAVVVLAERLRRGQVVGLLLGLVGVAVAAGLGGEDLSGSSLAGSLAAVAAGACYGISLTWMKRHLMDMPAVVAATGQLTVGAVLLAPFAVATTAASGADLAPHRLAAVAVLGVVGTGAAYVLFYRLVDEMGSTKASLVTYLVPVVAVVVGVVALDERFSLRMIVGGALIVAGIALVHQRARLRPFPRITAAAGAAPVLVVLALLTAACAGDDQATGAGGGGGGECGPPTHEIVDAASSVHVLPGAREPSYASDPPTSGPHLVGRLPSGALDAPIDRPTQVGLLEVGTVVIQHRGLEEDDRAALEDLAGPSVVVAPNDDLDTAVIATAWATRLRCTGAEVDAISGFVADRKGRGSAG